jgi:acyl-CoA hydrolase
MPHGNPGMPEYFRSVEAAVDAILRDVGKTIVLGLPLGLGKANSIVNALVARATADRSIRLTIFTALTLEKPRPSTDLERRFINPVIERLFGDYPDLDYASALHAGTLPENIEVIEFFFLAGQWLRSPVAQQNYISANYTHAFNYLLDRGVNVVTQLVAKRMIDGVPRFSLSCNTDITVDLLKARAAGRASFRFIGQVNSELPFMPGDGDLAADHFSGILDSSETDFPLFAPPSEPISDKKYAMGLHAAGLVRDGGSLQIGIGQIGDALAQSLIVRHRHNAEFIEMSNRLANGRLTAGHQSGAFEAGLYGISEMFFEAFLGLIEAGILKREVDGAVLHAAFFLGPKAFYRALREMSPDRIAQIQMKAVSFTNEVYEDFEAKRCARTDARFVNNAMMVTLLGAAVSDGLENGSVVSGVGGQYNFVAQAFALPGARSIITVESTRGTGKKIESNVRWSYGHQTIPRHLRDIVITEYGVADLRGKSDSDVIAAMLDVADSAFQPELLRQAKDAGKLSRSHEIPADHRENYAERITQALRPYRESGLLPAFPFGTDFTEAEQQLVPALQLLKDASASTSGVLKLAWQGLFAGSDDHAAALARLGLDSPKTMPERLYRLLVKAALARV